MTSTSKTNKYSSQNIETLELLYGAGYLSMGGDDEVARIVSKTRVAGKSVLDIGCGLGGALITLVRNHGAAHVHGIDIDADVLVRARALIEAAELQDRISLIRYQPGPFPLADESFDLVFVTAVSCHIEDLPPFFAEIRRVIRPGGLLVGGEWFLDVDNDAYRQWDDLLRRRGLNFYFVRRDVFRQALAAGGYESISIDDRSAAMASLSQEYLERVQLELRSQLLNRLGEEGYASMLEWTRIRANGLVSGGAGYGHFTARKPLDT